jgi:hypothetical protein
VCIFFSLHILVLKFFLALVFSTTVVAFGVSYGDRAQCRKERIFMYLN